VRRNNNNNNNNKLTDEVVVWPGLVDDVVEGLEHDRAGDEQHADAHAHVRLQLAVVHNLG
jgi:hypothetical protein